MGDNSIMQSKRNKAKKLVIANLVSSDAILAAMNSKSRGVKRGARRLLTTKFCVVAALTLAMTTPATVAQSQSPSEAATDDDVTLVIGTRIVMVSGASASGATTSAKSLFFDAHIPSKDFNKTDHCIDEGALDVAKEYFETLGRALGRAGHFYFVPDKEIKKLIEMCERLHQGPPTALAAGQTKIIAFGKVVPTVNAPALEKSLR